MLRGDDPASEEVPCASKRRLPATPTTVVVVLGLAGAVGCGVRNAVVVKRLGVVSARVVASVGAAVVGTTAEVGDMGDWVTVEPEATVKVGVGTRVGATAGPSGGPVGGEGGCGVVGVDGDGPDDDGVKGELLLSLISNQASTTSRGSPIVVDTTNLAMVPCVSGKGLSHLVLGWVHGF